MSSPSTLFEPDDDAWEQAALERRYALLEQLAEAGLRLALTIEGEAAQAAAAGQPVRDDAAMAFSRAARAVRLTVMLQAKLLEEPQAPRAPRAGADEADADQGPAAPPDLYVPTQVTRGRKVQGIVRGLAEDAGRDTETVERLVAEAGERMKRDDLYGVVRYRPFGELVAFICKELDLDPDWARLAKEAWQETDDEKAAARWSFHVAAARGRGRRRGRPHPAQAAAPFPVFRESS